MNAPNGTSISLLTFVHHIELLKIDSTNGTITQCTNTHTHTHSESEKADKMYEKALPTQADKFSCKCVSTCVVQVWAVSNRMIEKHIAERWCKKRSGKNRKGGGERVIVDISIAINEHQKIVVTESS